MHNNEKPFSDPLDLWLGKPAPRYTSYPTAPFFNTKVTTKAYKHSLKQIPQNEPVSVYVHIPFCRHLCLYCGCNTMATNSPKRIQDYLSAVRNEIRMVAALTGKLQISMLHFGGGTPNALGNDDIREIFKELRSDFDFSAVKEIAMELDPRVATEEQVKVLAECGVTRVSLGVQDFDPAVQEVINRIQPYDMVAELCKWLRAAGINRINFDLMYGLPKQTTATVTETALRVCALDPDRIALFSYAHVPQLKKHQKALEEYGIPDSHERLVLDQAVRGVLVSQDYQPIGIDHFARPDDTITRAWSEGKLSRGFQGYTEDIATTLLGFGASSISQTSEGYFQNEHDERRYQSILEGNTLPVQHGFLTSKDDKVRRAIIHHLMCYLSCDVEEICRAYACPLEIFAPEWEKLKIYQAAGLIRRESHTIFLTTQYRMAIRVICMVFDSYTQNAQTPASQTA